MGVKNPAPESAGHLCPRSGSRAEPLGRPWPLPQTVRLSERRRAPAQSGFGDPAGPNVPLFSAAGPRWPRELRRPPLRQLLHRDLQGDRTGMILHHGAHRHKSDRTRRRQHIGNGSASSACAIRCSWRESRACRRWHGSPDPDPLLWATSSGYSRVSNSALSTQSESSFAVALCLDRNRTGDLELWSPIPEQLTAQNSSAESEDVPFSNPIRQWDLVMAGHSERWRGGSTGRRLPTTSAHRPRWL
jgi:hypothetical protein